MHPLILGAGLLVGPAIGTAAGAACPGPGAALMEQFIAADCPGCWAGQRPAAALARGWQLDWITPAGSDAPLAAAALPEAADRLQRATLPAPTPGAAQVQRRAGVQARPGLSLRVAAGPAWQGYFGLQLSLLPPPRPAWPAGTTAWLALVELLPAGSEGNAAPRALVRSVAGPLPLDAAQPGQRLTHLRALRWPETAKPERLQARAWLEAPDGRVLAMAADRCP
ncbi:MAG: hypothetical protein JNL87_11195 [Burkholderiaceae bacterium]|nr:hypothetical protein [Burkholderiaceae bacterium]